ncbi:uncharacterized protein SOCE836_070360 [Sorangium cellulosum]|uniref:Uncharacterized protein n=1 Tax=Sorangium cellulosum TaxID=56 RepID=A0A4P2QWI6_SORCE|nr:uncharacterized protein SOCE836_070360 [Sorangium cellulosum]
MRGWSRTSATICYSCSATARRGRSRPAGGWWIVSVQRRLAGLPPEQRLAGLPPEQRLAGLPPEQRLLVAPDEALRLLPDDYLPGSKRRPSRLIVRWAGSRSSPPPRPSARPLPCRPPGCSARAR